MVWQGDGRLSEFVIWILVQRYIVWSVQFVVYWKSSHIWFYAKGFIFEGWLSAWGCLLNPNMWRICFHGSSQIVGKHHIYVISFGTLVDDLLKRPNTKGVLATHLLTIIIHCKSDSEILNVSRDGLFKLPWYSGVLADHLLIFQKKSHIMWHFPTIWLLPWKHSFTFWGSGDTPELIISL